MRAKSTVRFVFSAMLGSAILASPLFGSVANAALIGPILPYFGISDSPFRGVPELSTWAMMLLGFAGLGFAASRRRQKLAGV